MKYFSSSVTLHIVITKNLQFFSKMQSQSVKQQHALFISFTSKNPNTQIIICHHDMSFLLFFFFFFGGGVRLKETVTYHSHSIVEQRLSKHYDMQDFIDMHFFKHSQNGHGVNCRQ